jgi:hypothetical protein
MRQIVTTTTLIPATSSQTIEGVATLNPYDLTTLEVVKDELLIQESNTSYDVWIARQIQRQSAAVQNYCDRVFASEGLQDQIWLQSDAYPYQVPGQVAPLQLSRWPVSGVTSVTVNQGNQIIQTLTLGTDFALDMDQGQLTRLNVWTGFPTYWDSCPTTVQFQGGFEIIPADVEEAVLRLIAGAYQARTRDPLLKEEEQPGLGRKVYWIPNARESQFDPEVAEMLDKYRVPTIQ